MLETGGFDHGLAGPRHLRQRPPCDGAPRSVGALHRSRVRARGTPGPVRDPAGHAGPGEEPRRSPARSHPSVARRRPEDRVAGTARHGVRRVRGQRLGRPIADRRDGRRRPRSRRALSIAWAVRPGHRLRRPDRLRRSRAGVRHGHRPGLQRLAQGLLRSRAGPHVRCRDGRGPRCERRRGGSSAVRRATRLQGDLPSARGGEPSTVAPPGLRPVVGGDPAPRRPVGVPRWRADLPDARLRARGARPTHVVAHLQPAARHPVRDRLPVRWRRARALPRSQGRAARGQLLLGALVPVSPRRALGVDRVVRGTRADDATVGVLQTQLLDLGGSRRGDGAAVRRHVRRRTPHLLDGLPPRRFEVPARGRARSTSSR